jgi:2-polyprenyl-6-methoxyphenol hydroxylase-like FAD-dependent oxidoreductase
MGQFAPATVIVTIDRGDYWQCAFVFAKGGAEEIKKQGLDAFKQRVALAVPEIADEMTAIKSWEDVKLLSVSLDRLRRWHRPGLLAIGDAAHAMSPVGGVGINLAIQDAVAAANILALPLSRGEPVDRLLPEIQDRRLFPVRVIQGLQRAVHNKVLGPVLGTTERMEAPFAVRLLGRCPRLQRIPARIIGLGVRREHIRSPEASGMKGTAERGSAD